MNDRNGQPVDYMTAFGRALIDAGYDITSIAHGFKHPNRKGWQSDKVGLRHGADAAYAQHSRWSRDPSITGVGVLCRNVCAADIDCTDELMADHIAAVIERRLGKSVRRIGNPPRMLLVFRCAATLTPLKSRAYRDPDNQVFDANGDEVVHRLEFLAGDGRQFVAYGTHPQTSGPYTYVGPSLADVPIDTLPEITQSDMVALVAAFDTSAIKAGWLSVRKTPAGWVPDAIPSTPSSSTVGSLVPTIETVMPKYGADLDGIRDMLAKIDPDLPGPEYDIVIKAVCFETDGAPEALDVVRDWASAGAKWADSGFPQLRSRWNRAKQGPPKGVSPSRLATLQNWINKGEFAAIDYSSAPADAKARPLFELVQARAALNSREPLVWTVKGLIPSDSLGVFIGAPKSFKSYAALDLACRVATGTPYHGRKTVQGPVVYMVGEGQAATLDRLDAWSRKNDVAITSDTPLYVSGGAVNMHDPNSIKTVANVIDQLETPPALVIIDTLARHYGKDENSTEDMNAFANTVDTVVRARYGAAVVLVHHTGHDNKQRGRGSSVLLGALDFEYRVDREQGQDRFAFRNTNMRNGETADAIYFEADKVYLRDDGDGDPVHNLVFRETAAPVAQMPSVRDTLTGLMLAVYRLVEAEGPADFDVLWTIVQTEDDPAWDGETDKRRRQLRNTLQRLRDREVITVTDGGRYLVEGAFDDVPDTHVEN